MLTALDRYGTGTGPLWYDHGGFVLVFVYYTIIIEDMDAFSSKYLHNITATSYIYIYIDGMSIITLFGNRCLPSIARPCCWFYFVILHQIDIMINFSVMWYELLCIRLITCHVCVGWLVTSWVVNKLPFNWNDGAEWLSRSPESCV